MDIESPNSPDASENNNEDFEGVLESVKREERNMVEEASSDAERSVARLFRQATEENMNHNPEQ